MQQEQACSFVGENCESICKTDIKNDVAKNVTNINSVKITNSKDFRIGNETYYNSPVEIIVKDVTDEKLKEKLDIAKDEVQEEKKESPLKEVKIARRKLIFTVILSIAILALAIFLVVYFLVFNDEPDIECPTGHELKIVSRQDWYARSPKLIVSLKLPVDTVIITHSETKECYTMDDCIGRVNITQHYDMYERKLRDIGPNFLIGGDGYVYEGRGWEVAGAHTLGYNSRSIGIMYLGTFVNYKPTEVQLIAGKLLLCEGVKLGILSDEYKIYSFCQIRGGSNPGKTFMKVIKKWKRWGTDVKNMCLT